MKAAVEVRPLSSEGGGWGEGGVDPERGEEGEVLTSFFPSTNHTNP